MVSNMLSPPRTRIMTPPSCLELDLDYFEGHAWPSGGRDNKQKSGGGSSKRSSILGGRGSRSRRLQQQRGDGGGDGFLSPDISTLTPTPSPASPLQNSIPDPIQLVKVILLGAPAVGKSSIIQQFCWNEFNDQYSSTGSKQTYFSSVIINDHIYELKISDIPVIPYFPVNSFYEWTDFRFYGLRSATAYILVYDISNAETFQYIRTLREQMAESRDMRNVPVLVVGNKHDLVVESPFSHSSGGNSGNSSGGNNNSNNAVCLMEQGVRIADYAREKRDIANIVKKHWKCAYMECSAKYNWRVVGVFKEVMRMVDLLETHHTGAIGGGSHRESSFASPRGEGSNFGGRRQRRRCCIL